MPRTNLGAACQRNPLWNRIRESVDRGQVAAAVFLPFAAGYFLSYWIRTINGPLSDGLVASFGLGPRDLGVLTSLYFLAFAAFQIPAGLLIDRYGPRRVQSALFLVAAMGAVIFAGAHGRVPLMVGRVLIGLGCSAALVSGVKALALWLPPERRAIGNCCLVMCGGLGAMAAATPFGTIAGADNWRGVVAMFAVAAAAVSCLVWLVTPESARAAGGSSGATAVSGIGNGFARIARDRRFWRVAPLSGTVVGSAFAVHGLWAARWLADVAGADQAGIALVLLTMGASLTIGALVFGFAAARLHAIGVTTTQFFGWCCAAFMGIEAVLALDVPIPPIITLGAFGLFGAITVLSFTIIGELFSAEMAGRAIGALNVLHLGCAFAFQAGIGGIVSLWPPSGIGHPPAVAYETAFAAVIAIQAVTRAWFAMPTASRTLTHIARAGRFLFRARYRGDKPMANTPSANCRLVSRHDLDRAERLAVRRALGVGFAALIALVVTASALVVLAPGRQSDVAMLGP